jgi:hypothetical protein
MICFKKALEKAGPPSMAMSLLQNMPQHPHQSGDDVV